MKKIANSHITGIVILTAFCSNGLMAGEGWESRWYGGIGLGISRLNPDRNGTIYEVADDSSAGYKLTLGYDWSEKISVEGYYADLGEAKMSPQGEVEYRDLGVAGLYHFYQWEEPHQGLEAFAKVGLGFMKNDTDLNYERVHDGHLMLGLGAGYGFANGLQLRADLDLFDEDSQFISINLLKRFGGSEKAQETAPLVAAVPAVLQTEQEVVTQIDPPVLSDTDEDGVLDNIDDCPGTISGAEVGASGCASSWILQGVNFEHDRDQLKLESQKILNHVAQQLMSQKADRKIRIEGHTDASGPAAYNRQLSQRRAESVRNFLVDQGVQASLLTAVGKGESQPIADNQTVEGKARNRRVELHWQ